MMPSVEFSGKFDHRVKPFRCSRTLWVPHTRHHRIHVEWYAIAGRQKIIMSWLRPSLLEDTNHSGHYCKVRKRTVHLPKSDMNQTASKSQHIQYQCSQAQNGSSDRDIWENQAVISLGLLQCFWAHLTIKNA